MLLNSNITGTISMFQGTSERSNKNPQLLHGRLLINQQPACDPIGWRPAAAVVNSMRVRGGIMLSKLTPDKYNPRSDRDCSQLGALAYIKKQSSPCFYVCW